MVEEFSKLMRDMEVQDKQNREFRKLMLKKSREPCKTSKPQLAHGKFSLKAKEQLYKGAAKETKETFEAHIRKLMKPR